MPQVTPTETAPAPPPQSPIATVTQGAADLPAAQQAWGESAAGLGQAQGQALQSREQLAKKTAQYQGGLEQQAAQRYETQAAQIHPEKSVAFSPPKETLSGLAGLFSMVATMAFAGGNSQKSSGMAALAGMTGALRGYRQGDQQLFNNSIKQYDENLRKVQEDNAANLQMLDKIRQAYAVDRNAIPALVAEYQAKNAGSYDAALVQQGKWQAAYDFASKRVAADQQMAEKSAALINQLQMAHERNVTTLEAARIHAQSAIEAQRMKIQSEMGGPDGTGGSIENVAKQIATYRLPPLSGWSMRSPWGMRVMQAVAKINPQYDSTQYGAKSKAVSAFATGTQGNQVRSFNVAIFHLDTLQKLSDALDNGDAKAVNALSQQIAQQTGDPAPTSFNAARQIVGQEIVKAIVAGGGGVTERQDAAKSVSAANSPAQLAAVIKTYKELMGGQLRGLEKQYQQSTGLTNFNDFLYPQTQRELESASKTTAPATTGALPPGWSVQVH